MQRRDLNPSMSRPMRDAAGLFAAATDDHAAGRLGPAEQRYRQILAIDPRHAGSLHRLGLIAHQLGRSDVAVDYLRKAIAIDRNVAAYHSHLSLALAGLGSLAEAVDAAAAAVALAPGAADAQVNLGVMLAQLGRLDEAADHCRRAVSLAPALPDAHGNLAAVLQEQGRSAEAAEAYRHALRLEPGYVEAHTGLGNALLDIGEADDAVAHHRRAIALRPDFAEAHYNLGQVLRRLGRLDEAAAAYQAATKIAPGLAVAHAGLASIHKAFGRLPEAETVLRAALSVAGHHPAVLVDLALVLLAQGRAGEATRTIAQAMELAETPASRHAFVSCVTKLDVRDGAESFRPLLLRALRESWDRPEILARVTLDVVNRHPRVAASVARAAAAWPGPVSEKQLYGDEGVVAVAGDDLLQVMLGAMPNADMPFERFLTLARQVLLDGAEETTAPEAAIDFYAALARQCFLNEYVFRLDDDEYRRADILRERLDAALDEGAALKAETVLAVACYFPLASLSSADRLTERSWPAAVEAVLKQQIVEVREEAALRTGVPVLTAIRDGGSQKVRAQYEQSPYPRWLDAGAGEPPQQLADYLAAAFPLSALEPLSAGSAPEILVAGCGTGRNAVDTARAFKGARTLAVDLSLASLAHAVRKTREAGLADLDFAQADLLEMPALGRSFDFIEAAGVLHHLTDPLAGWRALLAMLRPGGVMKLGLYSALARRRLPASPGGALSAEAIRAARQSIAARQDEQALEALRAPDFYSLSGCRDLLFHVQETRFSLSEIDDFLRAEGLSLLGFVLPDEVRAAYQRRFPHDPAAINLANWKMFEADAPNTFAAMYQFWVQKKLTPS